MCVVATKLKYPIQPSPLGFIKLGTRSSSTLSRELQFREYYAINFNNYFKYFLL